MCSNHKRMYDSPTVTVVELKLESGVLTVSTNSPEDRVNNGFWGGNDTWF